MANSSQYDPQHVFDHIAKVMWKRGIREMDRHEVDEDPLVRAQLMNRVLEMLKARVLLGDPAIVTWVTN
jgi:hypothetical protein